MKRKSILQTADEKKFDAFNVINGIVFIGVLIAFITALGFSIKDIVVASNKIYYIYPIIRNALAIFIVFIPFLLKKIFGIQFPKLATIFYYLFLFISIYLGNNVDLFKITVFWDDIVHFIGSALIGFASMFVLRLFCKKRTQPLNYLLVFLFVFIFSFALSAIWEIFEFILDCIFNLNMQNYMQNANNLVGQTALFDTMLDVVFNLVGAFVSALICCICSYKNKVFISNFKVTKIKEEKTISQIEE